jgi:hypothetical protein
MTNMTGSKLSIFSHPGKITGYWITTRSFPYRGPYWPGSIWAWTLSQVNIGLDFVSCQYGNAHILICIYYTLRFYFPYLSLLAQPVTIFVYGSVTI